MKIHSNMTKDQEVWKNITGYENIYEVSNRGRIRSSKNKTTKSKRHGTRVWRQRVLKQKISKDNSCRVDLWKKKQAKTMLVHRLVAEEFIPKEKGKHFINHIDGNRLNNFVENLEWCTNKENNNHAFVNGLMPTNKFVVLEDLTNGDLKKFTSLSKASEFVGRNHNYIMDSIKRGDYIVDHYAIYTTQAKNSERVAYIEERLSNESEN